MFETLQKTFEESKNNQENSHYTQEDIAKIVNSYANQNLLIAAASRIVPGPLGIMSSIPEVILTMGNQMRMIYDLSGAFDKESFIN